MKRFLLFGYNCYYPTGGMTDFICDFNNAKEVCERDFSEKDIYEVLDTDAGTVDYPEWSVGLYADMLELRDSLPEKDCQELVKTWLMETFQCEESNGCDFCKVYDFAGVSATIDHGKYPHICTASGNTRYPKEEQFKYCPVCGKKRR